MGPECVVYTPLLNKVDLTPFSSLTVSVGVCVCVCVCVCVVLAYLCMFEAGDCLELLFGSKFVYT